MSKNCMRCLISGRVQGVGYRTATKNKAQELEVTGWVRNLPDKRVEVLLCGDAQQVNLLRDWLWQGPLAAKVNDVACEAVSEQSFAEFEILT
ncbi:MAG: acylphosphatase [Gammaproteobacteria bacterium]|nr:acylphosphatase [Gammaproteobacteria bacterium]